MEYESRFGYEVEDYPSIFQNYINSNLEQVTLDMTDRFLPVIEAKEVIVYDPTFAPSLAPSSSSSPTETCYWIDIAIVHDLCSSETSWEIQRIVGGGGDNVLIKSFQAADGDTSHTESMCLQEGVHEFTIHDILGGICCDFGEGNYKVTSNGALIGEGGEFGYSETTTFSIPFVSPP
mmetsp:Transcript_3961/g.8932  ORF Transcript_3961/g.8932 Transcript_3961/m.8932 type:complete len:177 (-) Transcript_3961:189-719(-)